MSKAGCGVQEAEVSMDDYELEKIASDCYGP